MILQFGGNPRIEKLWWLGILQDLVDCGGLVYLAALVEFLSAMHLVEIPELKTLVEKTLVVENFGG